MSFQFWYEWHDDYSPHILSCTIDNLKIIKMMFDDGYSIPDTLGYIEYDICAEHAIDLLFWAGNEVFDSFEFKAEPLDGNGEPLDEYGYDYQPCVIIDSEVEKLFQLVPVEKWEEVCEILEDSITTDHHASMWMAVSEMKDGFAVEFYQFDYNHLSDFVWTWLAVKGRLRKLLEDFSKKHTAEGDVTIESSNSL